MEDNTLQKLWEHEIIILDEFVRVCEKHNLRYYLMWGTLLGAVRHGGFIPWDDDIDICMPRADYNKFIKIAPAELESRFFLQSSKTDKYHPVEFAKIRLNNTAFYCKGDKNFKRHRGIFIDIFPLDSRKRKASIFYKIKQKCANKIKQHICNYRQGNSTRSTWFLHIFPYSWLTCWRDKLYEGKGECYQSDGVVFDAEDFSTVIKMDFAGKKYDAPHNYDKVLTALYGDYMKLPPENERVAHFPEFISFDLEKDRDAADEKIKNLQ